MTNEHDYEDSTSDSGKQSQHQKQKKTASNRKKAKPRKRTEDERKILKEKNKIMLLLSKTLLKHPWFHGLVIRDDIEGLIFRNRAWIVRMGINRGLRVFTLTTRVSDKIINLPLTYRNGCWSQDFSGSRAAREPFAKLYMLLDKLSECSRIETPVPRPPYSLFHSNVHLEKKRATGEYGEIYNAKLTHFGNTHTVAVRRLSGCINREIGMEYLREAAMMRGVTHRNVLRIYGVANLEDPIMIVYEMAAGGNLKVYFKRHPQATQEQQLKLATDVCRGMAYLHMKKIVHRQLSARSCVLGTNQDVKVTNFGFAVHKQPETKETTINTALIKWLPRETVVRGVFSEKSDVWSYSVTLWEIYTRCATEPLIGLTNREAALFIKKEEYPIKPPKEAPDAIYRAMMQCFARKPAERPTFLELLTILSPTEKTVCDAVDKRPPVVTSQPPPPPVSQAPEKEDDVMDKISMIDGDALAKTQTESVVGEVTTEQPPALQAVPTEAPDTKNSLHQPPPPANLTPAECAPPPPANTAEALKPSEKPPTVEARSPTGGQPAPVAVPPPANSADVVKQGPPPQLPAPLPTGNSAKAVKDARTPKKPPPHTADVLKGPPPPSEEPDLLEAANSTAPKPSMKVVKPPSRGKKSTSKRDEDVAFVDEKKSSTELPELPDLLSLFDMPPAYTMNFPGNNKKKRP